MNRPLPSHDTDALRASAVARLLRTLDRRTLSAEQAAGMTADYLQVLRGLPAEMVAQAVDRFCRGLVETANPAFCPTTAEVYREGIRLLGEQERSAPRLPPPHEPGIAPAERARVAAGMDSLVKEMAASMRAETEEAQRKQAELMAEANRRFEEREREELKRLGLPSEPVGGILVSSSLHAKVAEWAKNDAYEAMLKARRPPQDHAA